jgi:hypothetical protein
MEIPFPSRIVIAKCIMITKSHHGVQTLKDGPKEHDTATWPACDESIRYAKDWRR